jgi:hypothetical protein
MVLPALVQQAIVCDLGEKLFAITNVSNLLRLPS